MNKILGFNKIPINLTQILVENTIKINILPSTIYPTTQYLLNYQKNNNYNLIKCWKSKTFLTSYMNNYEKTNSIYYIEFLTQKENIKINHLSINNDFYYKNLNKQILINDENYKIIKKTILNDYLINFGKKNNYKNIIIDVHENMKRYDYELKEEGFKIENKCSTNPFYYEAIKTI